MIDLVGPDPDVAAGVGLTLLYGGLGVCAVLVAWALYDLWRGDR